ncbi:hypothetical protein J1614_010620 [Plenodomus biglobosus]|nr:hypothetical protein J1614_010620 [Plenodomus biglobosus]
MNLLTPTLISLMAALTIAKLDNKVDTNCPAIGEKLAACYKGPVCGYISDKRPLACRNRCRREWCKKNAGWGSSFCPELCTYELE